MAPLVIVVGGVTGSILVIGSSNKNKDANYLVHKNIENNNSYLKEEQNKKLSDGLSDKEAENANTINQLSSWKEKSVKHNEQESVSKKLEVDPASKVNLGESSTNQCEKVKTLETARENSPYMKKNDLGASSNDTLLEKKKQMEEFYNEQSVIEESLSYKNKDSSHTNWFSISLSEDDIFDEREWPSYECQKQLNNKGVVFKCPWFEDSSKMIELHLSLASDPELKGKRWENIEGFHFISRSESLATLGLTFLDSSEKEITLILKRKDS